MDTPFGSETLAFFGENVSGQDLADPMPYKKGVTFTIGLSLDREPNSNPETFTTARR